MKISIPELSLVLLVGPSGSGKSTFGRKHFLPTEVVSSDFCRALVSDNENDQSAIGDAFDLLHEIVRKRLARGRLTVVDATNVQPEARKSLIALAKEFHLFAEAIVFDLSERVCQDRNVLRPDRQFGPHVIRNQSQQLRRSLRGLEREGIRHVFKLSSPEEVDAVTIERHPLWNNKKTEHGPFDIIGDVHGCFDELVELMAQLGYVVNQTDGVYSVSSSGDRKLVFVGDLVDRGPGTVQVLHLVSSMVQAGQAFCVPGNHDIKLVRALRGKEVKRTHGLDRRGTSHGEAQRLAQAIHVRCQNGNVLPTSRCRNVEQLLLHHIRRDDDAIDLLALAAMGRDCVPMRELSIVSGDAPAIVEMNAVAVHAAHGGQLTVRCTEALILAIRKHEELVTRSYLYRLAFMDGERPGLSDAHLRLTAAPVACRDEFFRG